MMKTKLLQSIMTTVALAVIALSTACNSTLSYVECTQELADNWAAGNFEEAEEISADLLCDQKGKIENNIVFYLEHANVLRANHKFAESNEAFQTALNLMNDRETDSTASKGGREVAAAVANLNVMIYRGYAYDRIMAHTYRALNYLALGDIDAARIEFKRLYEAQSTAVQKYGEQITKDMNEVAESDQETRKGFEKTDFDVLTNNSGFNDALTGVMSSLPDINPAYGPYANPFSEYLQGIFLTTNHQDDSDLENGLKSLTRTLAMSGSNNHIETDIARVSNREAAENVTYVIFESGVAPHREEEEFPFPPIPIEYEYEVEDEYGNKRIEKGVWVLKIKAKYPILVENKKNPVQLIVSAGGNRNTITGTHPLTSIDSVVAKEFELRWPGIRNRIVLATMVKTTGSILAIKEFGWLGGLAGNLYMDVMKGTDSRTWRTLPKNIQVCRIPTPADRKITLRMSNRPEWNSPIEIMPGKVNVVYVKQTSAGTVPKHHQFKLK